MSRQLIIAWVALLALACGNPLHAQIAGVDQVVRRGDGRALILILSDGLADGQITLTPQAFRLFDLQSGHQIPLSLQAYTQPPRCPGPDADGEPSNHLCVELSAGGDALVDSATYALVAGRVQVGADQIVGPGSFTLPAVGGAVDKPGSGAPRIVTATYSLDLSSRTDVDPELWIGGSRVPIDPVLNPRVDGMPLCYRRANFDFSCRVRRDFENGDTVEVRLVVRGTGMVADLPPLKPAVAAVARPEGRDDAKIYASGAFSRVSGEEEGTLEFTLREFPVYHFGRAAAKTEGWLTPFVDLSLSTGGEAGRVDLGAQLTTRFRDLSGWLPLVDLRITPRRESDQDNEISNWIYADAEARLFLVPFYTGRLPARGTYHVIPRLGVERGRTTGGEDLARLEANHPSRFNTGVEASASWPAGWLTAGDVVVTFDWETYRLRLRDGVDEDRKWTQLLSLQARLQLTRDFGISVTRRKGRQAPTFLEESTFEIGGTFMR